MRPGWLAALLAWAIGCGMVGAQTPAEWRQIGLARRGQGDWPGAIAALEMATTQEPQNPTSYVLLGWTQHLAGQSAPAARSLWQAIARQPTHVEAFQALGIVYLVRGEVTPAIWSHLWAAVLNPQGEIAPYNLSLAYHGKGCRPWLWPTVGGRQRWSPKILTPGWLWPWPTTKMAIRRRRARLYKRHVNSNKASTIRGFVERI
ncbi:MAG: hypothetical protein HC918_09455 [Oscillatoriales cyanobacterium SM2_1_8]|nr:hypothetical protein [Oscillatoriales cyanobacterium SM2_1_8]